jgi:Protein of unknown function (DUF1496)
MAQHVKQVGAPDPERRNSPIIDDEDDVTLDLELEAGVCYFNDQRYTIGSYVMSGDEVLHCEERGVWVKKGERQP